jgi:response regulator RpfG family c-di-GMP phosphodiesterase
MHRIMLVDDEPNILNALRRVLSRQVDEQAAPAYQIEAFENPPDALRRAEHVAFDLVVSDYRMPEMSGVEFLRRLIEIQPRVARLILSGYADLEGLVGAINEARIDRFIAKPWHDFELCSAVEQALDRRRLALENERLADLVRVQRGKMTRQEMELRRLEAQYPGLTRVKRGADDAIEIDASEADGTA